eukprot:Hpha_TRINITY_DN19679_c0_g1::TRINITY_DN19679_c0_g1_i1::g.186155::m.186155
MAGSPGGWQKQLQAIGKDWNCGLCGASNDKGRPTCFQCGNLHHVGGGMRSVAGRDSFYSLPTGTAQQSGDWKCIMCGQPNYANRYQCYKCGVGKPKKAPPGWEAKAEAEKLAQHPAVQSGKLPARCYFDIAVDGEPLGRIEFIVKAETPKTSENFRALCTGSRGPSYVGTRFHRVIPNFMVQGGDFTKHDGTGGRSIYGETFEDETFRFKHTGPGVLSMANAGPNTNGSQFFILCRATPHLDGKHVVFGEVDRGMDVVRVIEKLGSKAGKCSKKVTIVKCGQLRLESKGGPSGLKKKPVMKRGATTAESDDESSSDAPARKLPRRTAGSAWNPWGIGKEKGPAAGAGSDDDVAEA